MIEYAVTTEIGDKEKNEDSVRVFVNQKYSTYGFVAADGLGGHGNGDVASSLVTECVGAGIETNDDFSSIFIDDCFASAQEILMKEKERRGLYSIKTTMSLLVITNNVAHWGHIGDTRIYYFRGGKMIDRTLDHSLPQMLALSGEIKEKDIRHHESRNMLLRAMGTEWDEPQFEIDKRRHRLKTGDTFLICTDGFWEWIEDKTMSKILKKELSAYDSLTLMNEEVLKNAREAEADMDNYSAILITVR